MSADSPALRLFISILACVLCISAPVSSQTHVADEAARPKIVSAKRFIPAGIRRGSRPEINRTLLRINDPNEAPHTLVGGFYDITNGKRSRLLLNNKGPRPLEVQPLVYNPQGQVLPIPALIVPSNSFQIVNLADWVGGADTSFRRGSLELFHRGKPIVLGTQVEIIDEQNSLIFENKLEEKGMFDSRRLETVWVSPSDETETVVIVKNTSSQLLTVAAQLTRNPSIRNTPQQIILLPNETKALNLREDFNQGETFGNARFLGLTLRHDGEADALLAWGMVKEASKGYSNILNFTNPAGAASKDLHGTGLQLGSVGDDELRAVLVLRNVSNESIQTRVAIPYTKRNGVKGRLVLDPIGLSPGEMSRVDLSHLNGADQIKTAGIEIRHNGAVGSLIASAQSVSESRNQVFRVLFWDPPAAKSAASIYPFDIRGSLTAKAYIKNTSAKAERYVAYITWANGGMYMLGLNDIAQGETIEIDVKDLRNRQVPDEEGRVIPQGISQGQVHWALKRSETTQEDAAGNRIPLIGQMLQADTERGLSITYFCLNCCEYGAYSFAYMVPGNVEVSYGGSVQYYAYEEGSDCYGNFFSVNVTSSAYWSSSNTTVADVVAGLVTTTAPGQTEIKAKVDLQEYIEIGECEGGGGGPYLTKPLLDFSLQGIGETLFSGISFQAEERNRRATLLPCDCWVWSYEASLTADVTVTPVITAISPTGVIRDGNFLVQIYGTNLGDFSPPPTVNVSGNGVTVSNVVEIQNPTGLEATFAIAANAEVSDRSVTVTVDGATSNALTFRVGDTTPVITSIMEDEGSTGEILPVTITGTNFGLLPDLIVDSGIAATIQSRSDTQIQATFAIGESAPAGPRDVKVKSNGVTGGGFLPGPGQSDTSAPESFTIHDPQPSISEIKLVERYGTTSVQLGVTDGVANQDVDFRIRTTSGNGTAVFDDGMGNTSTERTITGSATQNLYVRGVSTSSTVDNVVIEAFRDGISGPIVSEAFTVAEITAVEFERIHTSPNSSNENQIDPPLDDNPGTDGIHTPGEGLRIYPGRTRPDNATDRGLLRVKATVAPSNLSKAYVYFASFDVDDPSASTGPIDPGDVQSAPFNDNRGEVTVSGVGSSKSGIFSNPSGGSCDPATTASHISKITCQIGGTQALANLKVPMNPGDNLAVAASLQETYRDQIHIQQTAPGELVNTANQVLVVSGNSNPTSTQGLRTKLLTVWRKVHIEVDSMTDPGTTNKVSATVNGTVTIPASTPQQGHGTASVTVTTNTAFDFERFRLGAMVQGLDYFVIGDSTASTGSGPYSTTLTVINTYTSQVTISNNSTVTLYDDDDFDADDFTIANGLITNHAVDGDKNEAIAEDTESFRYMRAGDGVYSNGDLRNVLSQAYVMPDYSWAQQFKQTNVPFDLNVVEGVNGANYVAAINSNRGSASSERDDFWVGYVLFTYQGPEDEDFDGQPNSTNQEAAVLGVTVKFAIPGLRMSCDCYQSPSCPSVRVSCTNFSTGAPQIPVGRDGSLIFMEVAQDLTRFFGLGTNPQDLEEVSLNPLHEFSHQFGLLGDRTRNLIDASFHVMDYEDYPNNLTVSTELHPEHINIIRWRVKSPGEN